MTTTNEYMLDTLEATKEAMGDKPVIVYMRESKPMVWSEVEPLADAIIVGYSISDQAAVDIIAGVAEPSGLLPMQQPANMETVEAQNEDTPMDMECYVDAAGNSYDVAFGMNWSGVISDERAEKYAPKAAESSDAEETTDAEEDTTEEAAEETAEETTEESAE